MVKTFLLAVFAVLLSVVISEASVTFDDPKQQAAYEEITIALTYIKYGQLDEALEALNESIRLFPNFDAYYNRGLVYTDKKDYRKATENFEKAFEIKPRDLGLNYNFGVALLETGRFKEAVPKFERLLEDDPRDKHVAELLKKAKEGLK